MKEFVLRLHFMFSYSIPLRFSLGNNTQDCDTCISKLEDNGICSCIQNGCNPYSSGIIPNECIHHFIANEDGNPECLGRMISHFSHCEPNHSGNFIIFVRLLRNEIELKSRSGWGFIQLYYPMFRD